MDTQHPQPFESPSSYQEHNPPYSSPSVGYPPNERVEPNELRRALEATIQNGNNTATGRFTRNQVAPRLRRTPGISSFHSNRARTMSQGRVEQTNRNTLGTPSYDYGQENGFGTRNAYGQQPGYTQHNDYDQRRHHGRQNGSHHQTAYRSQTRPDSHSEVVSSPAPP